jgi:hypothetical protein
MVEERTVYLINADIDGELSPEERAELAELLETSDEARALRAELRKLATLMDDLPERVPPAGLSDRIVARVRLPESRTGVTRARAPLKGILAAFQPVPAGLAFAAGLLLTVGYYEVAQRGGEPADLSSMVGTMVAKPSGFVGRKKDSMRITQPGLTGMVSLGEVGEFLVLNFDIESVDPTEIEVGYADAGLGFGGIAHVSSDSNTQDESFQVSGGTLRVVNQGRQAFSVFLPRVTDTSRHQVANREGDGRQIFIGISSGGTVVFSGALQG